MRQMRILIAVLESISGAKTPCCGNKDLIQVFFETVWVEGASCCM